MIRISMGSAELSDSFLRRIVQLGVDCVDLGCPPPDGLSALKKRIRSFGLDVNRISLPDMSAAFMRGEDGSGKELDSVERTLRAFGDAGYRLTFQRFEGSNFNHLVTFYESVHRGGYRGSGKSVWLTGRRPPERPEAELRQARIAYWPHFGHDEPPDRAELDAWWGQFCRVFERLVPVAEEYEMRIGVHPADLPLADTPFGTLGFHRVIDAFPSRNVGYLYCCGTRAEAGGLPLVLEEIHNYGRQGRLFMIHFRNIRGSLMTSSAYEEVLLDDGDMNMFKILLELHRVGFDGCLSPDHIFRLEGDPDASTDQNRAYQGLAFSIGYLKGLLAALAVVG
jgi:mannonate dehydratase